MQSYARYLRDIVRFQYCVENASAFVTAAQKWVVWRCETNACDDEVPLRSDAVDVYLPVAQRGRGLPAHVALSHRLRHLFGFFEMSLGMIRPDLLQMEPCTSTLEEPSRSPAPEVDINSEVTGAKEEEVLRRASAYLQAWLFLRHKTYSVKWHFALMN